MCQFSSLFGPRKIQRNRVHLNWATKMIKIKCLYLNGKRIYFRMRRALFKQAYYVFLCVFSANYSDKSKPSHQNALIIIIYYYVL